MDLDYQFSSNHFGDFNQVQYEYDDSLMTFGMEIDDVDLEDETFLRSIKDAIAEERMTKESKNNAFDKRSISKDHRSLSLSPQPAMSLDSPGPSTSLPSSPTEIKKNQARAKQLCIVMDTNIFISSTSSFCQIKQAIAKSRFKSDVQFIIPWMVVNELDGLKNSQNEKVAKHARHANALLLNLLQAKDPQIHVQKSYETYQSKQLEVHCPDDKILQCCLYFQKVAKEEQKIKEKIIVLLSHDKNLQIKALVHSIEALGIATLPTQIKELGFDVEIHLENKAIKNLLDSTSSTSFGNTPRRGSLTESLNPFPIAPPIDLDKKPQTYILEAWGYFSEAVSPLIKNVSLDDVDIHKLETNSINILKNQKNIDQNGALVAKSILGVMNKEKLSFAECAECLNEIAKLFKSITLETVKKRKTIKKIEMVRKEFAARLRLLLVEKPEHVRNEIYNNVKQKNNDVNMPLIKECLQRILRLCSSLFSNAFPKILLQNYVDKDKLIRINEGEDFLFDFPGLIIASDNTVMLFANDAEMQEYIFQIVPFTKPDLFSICLDDIRHTIGLTEKIMNLLPLDSKHVLSAKINIKEVKRKIRTQGVNEMNYLPLEPPSNNVDRIASIVDNYYVAYANHSYMDIKSKIFIPSLEPGMLLSSFKFIVEAYISKLELINWKRLRYWEPMYREFHSLLQNICHLFHFNSEESHEVMTTKLIDALASFISTFGNVTVPTGTDVSVPTVASNFLAYLQELETNNQLPSLLDEIVNFCSTGLQAIENILTPQ